MKKLVKNLENAESYHPVLRAQRTFGQKSADKLTKLVGSWTFIFIVLLYMALWIFANSYFLVKYKSGDPFDPYPFIILNLTLSFLAALQAPIILMSHNRQSHIDRLKMEYDYNIDKKAEHEIREIKEMLRKMMK